MNRKHIDTLITYLMAIERYAKDLHYDCSGSNFYSNHEFADRFIVNMEDYLDQLKEVSLLGNGYKPLRSRVYMHLAADLIPIKSSFRSMRVLMKNTLGVIDNITALGRGDEDLIGSIARDIQNNIGLLNIMFNNSGD